MATIPRTSSKRVANIRISLALCFAVDWSSTCSCFQTASNPWDFRIPDEDDDLENMFPPAPSSWLDRLHNDGYYSFDANDPFRYEVGKIRTKPGHKLKETLGLAAQVGQ